MLGRHAIVETLVQLCIPESDAEHIKRWGRKIQTKAEASAATALRIVGSTTDVTPDFERIK